MTSPTLAKFALAVPPALRPLWFLGRRQRDGQRVMDASAQALGEFLVAMRPPNYDPTPDEARRQLRTMIAIADNPGPALPRREDIRIAGPAGDIPARIYAPTRDAGLPVLVYLHGGGWVIGDLDSYDNVCSKLAAWANCMVVSVDYRLAPEHKFPAAPEDCIAAYRWIEEHAGELGGDPERLAIGGDSAGGNLTAVVCQAVAQSSGTAPRLQVLIYPGLDMRGGTASHRELADAFVLPKDRIDWFTSHYLNSDDDRLDPRASPGLTADVAGQPPAYVVVCGFDPLRDEALDYAGRLRQAGVAVELREFPGQIHGFTFLTKLVPEGDVCLREIANALDRAW
jgi:acetyl esterase